MTLIDLATMAVLYIASVLTTAVHLQWRQLGALRTLHELATLTVKQTMQTHADLSSLAQLMADQLRQERDILHQERAASQSLIALLNNHLTLRRSTVFTDNHGHVEDPAHD